MYFSTDETRRRFDALREMIRRENLRAVVLATRGANHTLNDEFYFLQSEFIPAGDSITLVADGRQPVTFARTINQWDSHRVHSAVDDVREVLGDPAEAILEMLREAGITEGRVGMRLLTLPTSWYRSLTTALPDVEWVDVTRELLDLYYAGSAEEAAAAASSAEIADASYRHILNVLEPGMTEVDVVAEFEHDALRRGANKNFTLIASGRIDPATAFPELTSPSRRRLEPGDSVMLEMTPAVSGYYTQLVRTISVGEPNPYADELRSVCVDAIQAAREVLSPGCTVGDVAHAIIKSVSGAGLDAEYPLGHTVGVNLIYDRLHPDSDRRLSEHDTLIIHPRIRRRGEAPPFFWGETYAVTADGNRRLHRADDVMHTVVSS